jgi:small subunit ribosomal protein S21
VIFLPGVHYRDGESFEQLLKRFKKQCEKAGILSEVRKREHFEKPSMSRKKKSLAAQKRIMKKQRRSSR